MHPILFRVSAETRRSAAAHSLQRAATVLDNLKVRLPAAKPGKI